MEKDKIQETNIKNVEKIENNILKNMTSHKEQRENIIEQN